jgi:hypothetical protein
MSGIGILAQRVRFERWKAEVRARKCERCGAWTPGADLYPHHYEDFVPGVGLTAAMLWLCPECVEGPRPEGRTRSDTNGV